MVYNIIYYVLISTAY